MIHVSGERAMKCPGCGHHAYPRISPAMMVLVKRGEAILLARNAAAPPGRMSALAGFLEAGESIEDAIHREVARRSGCR
jgi:NAD+ diphosphatase